MKAASETQLTNRHVMTQLISIYATLARTTQHTQYTVLTPCSFFHFLNRPFTLAQRSCSPISICEHLGAAQPTTQCPSPALPFERHLPLVKRAPPPFQLLPPQTPPITPLTPTPRIPSLTPGSKSRLLFYKDSEYRPGSTPPSLLPPALHCPCTIISIIPYPLSISAASSWTPG